MPWNALRFRHILVNWLCSIHCFWKALSTAFRNNLAAQSAYMLVINDQQRLKWKTIFLSLYIIDQYIVS